MEGENIYSLCMDESTPFLTTNVDIRYNFLVNYIPTDFRGNWPSRRASYANTASLTNKRCIEEVHQLLTQLRSLSGRASLSDRFVRSQRSCPPPSERTKEDLGPGRERPNLPLLVIETVEKVVKHLAGCHCYRHHFSQDLKCCHRAHQRWFRLPTKHPLRDLW